MTPSITTPTVGAGVAVVILNWRAAEMTLHAVRRAFDQSLQPQRVFVVDNASGDGSADILKRALEDDYGNRATLLINDRNLGFGGGCNTALRAALADNFEYCWLLNNDAEPHPSCLAELMATAANTPSVGAVGSLMIDPKAPGSDHFGSWLHPITLATHPVYSAEELRLHRFAWLTAASLLIPVTALRRVGLFDERYFMYWEDADLNMRLRAANYMLATAPKAAVIHAAGTSSRDMPSQRYVWHFMSQRLWLISHHSFPGAMTIWLRIKYLLKAAIDRDLARLRALLRS